MLIKGKATYKFGGWPTPHYSGVVEESVNVDDNADSDECRAALVKKMSNEVRRRNAWNGNVLLEDLTWEVV